MASYTTEFNGSVNQQKCAITGEDFMHGDKITRYNRAEYEAVLRSIGLVEDVAAMAAEQTQYTTKNFGKWCLADIFLTRKKTRSGRTVKPVVRMSDLTFVTGSGVTGCDTYDRCYDRGEDTSRAKGCGSDSKFLNRNLDEFVVEDDDVGALETVDLDEPEHDPKECGSDWDTSDSEEEEEWAQSDSDEEEEEDHDTEDEDD